MRAFRAWRRARAGTAVPVPSVHAPWVCMHYAATRRLEHARITLHVYKCARELKTRAEPDSFKVTAGCVRCALARIANMPHAYDDTSHARMTQQVYECARKLKPHAQRAFAAPMCAHVCGL